MSWVRRYAVLAALVIAVLFTAGATSAAPTAPTIDSAPPALTNQTVDLSFTFSDPDPTTTSFECSLDSPGTHAPCTSPQTYPATEGTHTFRVWALDATDALSDPASYTLTVDRTPPPAPAIGAKPADPTNSTSPSFGFTDGEAGVGFQCQLDGSAFSSCTSPKSYTGVGSGSHAFAVRAVDAAGNQGAATPYSWTIDTTAPTITFNTTPAKISNDPTPTFGFSANEATPGGFQCQLDGGASAGCSMSTTLGTTAGGPHTFTVRASDAAGNPGAASYTWTIDTAPPLLSITSKPSDPSGVATAHFEFAATDATSVTFQCQLDSGAAQSCATPPGKDYSGLASARHTLTLTGTDAAGNASTSAYSWMVDTINPVVTIAQAPTNPTDQTSPSFSFSSSKASSSFQCGLDGGGFSTCTSPTTYTSLKGGSHSFSVRATDPIGHTGPTTTYAWTIDLTPPGQVRSLRKIIQYGRITLAWVLPTDADFDHVQVLVSKGAKKNAQSVAYAGKATQYTDGRFKNGTSYRYAIVSYDHLGNSSQPFRVTVAASVLLLSPRKGSTLRSPPRLRWSSVPKATFYNVQLYRGGSKILSAWPRAASLRLKRHWSYSGRHYRLKKGLYQWFVWPGFGPKAKDRYGQLLGQSAFRVR